MLIPHYSHCHTRTCFSLQGAIPRIYCYISWAGSTKCMSRCKYQIKEQFCWPCSWNISVLPEDGPLKSETCPSITGWIKWY